MSNKLHKAKTDKPLKGATSDQVAKLTALANKLIQMIGYFAKGIFRRCSSRHLQGGELDRILILSVSDGENRAKVMTFSVQHQSEAEWIQEITQTIEKKLKTAQDKFAAPLCWLRLEWVIRQEKTNWADFSGNLRRYKRNYFRSGIAFPGTKEPWLLLTEMEINANACLYPGNDEPTAQVNQNNLEIYIRARHGSSQIPKFSEDLPIIMFQTDGVFLDAQTGQIHILCTAPRQQGHRKMPELSFDSLQELIDLSSQYLSSQIQENGQYRYGYFPCFGREIPTYNTLRHASSTYALLEGYEACRTFLDTGKTPDISAPIISKQRVTTDTLAEMQKRIGKALHYLITYWIRHYKDNLAYLTDTENEIKLGGNAVTILALVKYVSVFPGGNNNTTYLELAQKLANGIIATQQEDGSFVHVLEAGDLSIKRKKRIIYYDGEAAFSLMRLYGITHEQKLLDCVVHAFEYFIANHHEKAHDHWLAYCSNELVKYLPEKKYFDFAVRNIRGHVIFIRERITTFPTLLELSMAFHNTLMQLETFPNFRDVLKGFNVSDFYHALHTRANYLINGFFFPEMAMFYKYPKAILHGMFIRHHAFRVRIDDVEHYLSGLVAYQKLMATELYPVSFTEKYETNIYTACSLASATDGKWMIEPPENWQATGICITPTHFSSGHMLVARGKKMEKGYLPEVSIHSLLLKGGTAVITDDPEHYRDMGAPVLSVANVCQATLDIGKMARHHYLGKVIGVTGSAGKTTSVAMLAHVLSSFGKVGQTADSANLPIGIAWNMASMPQDAKYWVLEMAIGRMAMNSQMALPDVAVITNIAPVHLEYHHNVENIALKKSLIFEKMQIGSLAVICRDIAQYDLIRAQAKLYGLKVVSYGKHPESDIRLMKYENNIAYVQIGERSIVIELQAHGQHMALNAMAVFAVTQHYHLDIPTVLKSIGSFQPVTGRGETKKLQIGDKTIQIIDESYNANPLSMQAALSAFADSDCPPRHRVVILGDMLELGDDAEKYHLDLAPILFELQARVIILCGELMRSLYLNILRSQTGENIFWCKNLDDIIELLNKNDELLQSNDKILIKSSHGIGLYKLVSFFKEKST